MKHYFFTRIACDARTIYPKSRIRSDAEIRQIIGTWLDYSREFYHSQTVRVPFQVMLRYSNMYRQTVKDFSWPDYCDLHPGWLNEWAAANIPVGEECTLSRVDADDSYSVDFMEYLEQLKYPKRTLILHKKIKQLRVDTGEWTNVMTHRSPMFATIYFPSWPGFEYKDRHGNMDVMEGIQGNHGKYRTVPHETSPKCFALMRITGRNAANRWKTLGVRNINDVTVTKEPDPRFVGYEK